MSEEAPVVPETPEAPTPPAAEPPAEPTQLPTDHPLVKTLEAQKVEIRTLKEKAARLDQIEEANKTEAQKQADRMAAAEQRAADAEARVLRRELAIEHKLSADDLVLLDKITDEDALRALASRLEPATGRPPAPNPAQGTSPSAPQGPAQLTRQDVERLAREGKHHEIEKARQEGRLDDVLSGKS